MVRYGRWHDQHPPVKINESKIHAHIALWEEEIFAFKFDSSGVLQDSIEQAKLRDAQEYVEKIRANWTNDLEQDRPTKA